MRRSGRIIYLTTLAIPFVSANISWWLRQGFFGRSGAGAFTFPFVMFAETGEMFLHLDFKFGEGGFADGGEMFAFVGGVERAGRKGEIQGEAEFLGSRNDGKNTMKLNEIGIKTFQKLV